MDEFQNKFLLDVVVLRMSHIWLVNYNYLVINPINKKAVLVDPAWQMDKIETALISNEASLEAVLLTHSHPDHIHLSKKISLEYNCPIMMSEQEINYSGYSASRLVGIDNASLSIGGISIDPILTPGHTPGCICYFIGNNIFTGDVLFAEGCGLCPDHLSACEMFDSLECLKKNLNPNTKIYPGHSYGKIPGQKFSDVLKENIYLQFKDRESFARFRMRKKQNKAKMFNFK